MGKPPRPSPPPGGARKGESPSRDAETRTLAGETPRESPRSKRAGATFVAGEQVGGRYRVERFIARGGMGEVYEVLDEKLGERVALKTVSPEQFGRSEHLRREVLLARKVTHPNVCRIFDVGEHKDAGETRLFLTMELLAGETLRERIKRAPMPRAELQSIASQIAEALEAAHRAGVVHRDLKSSNVMLMPDGRAVVTDFGIAAHTTEGGEQVGSPHYVAPEQLEGKEPTPAADVYAFGVVLYEMASGTWPFVGESATEIANKRLNEPAPPLRARVPAAPEALNRAIARCLERDPAKRFARPRDVVAALAAGRRSRTGFVIAAGLAIVAAAAAGGYVLKQKGAARKDGKLTIAVLPPRDLDAPDSPSWHSSALAELITQDLQRAPALRVASSERVAQAARSLPAGAPLDDAAFEKLARAAAADVLITGSYRKESGQLALDLAVRLPHEVIGTSQGRGPEADLAAAAREAIAGIHRALGATPDAREPSAGLPAAVETARDYAEGLAAHRAGNIAEAQRLLGGVVTAAPDFALGHSAYSRVLRAGGDHKRARSEAKLALDHSASLGRIERLVLEARYQEALGDNAKAADAYRALVGLDPGNADWVVPFAGILGMSNHVKEGLEALDELRRKNPRADETGSLDEMESLLYARQTDYKGSLAAATRAVVKAQAAGLPSVEAAARLREAAALRELGEAPRALAAAKDAREKMLALGMKSDANHALRRIATILYDMGETQKARELFEQQLAEARATGFRVSLKAGLIDYAMLLIRIDDRLAIPYHKEALEMAIEDGDEPGQQAALGNLSLSLMNIGEIEDARVKLEKATEMARRLGRKLDYPIRLGNLTELHIELGRLPEAQKYAEEASEKYQEIQHEDGIANIRQLQGTILRELGDPAGARGRYEECVRIAEKLAIKGRLAHCRRELAWLAAGRGELDEAERLAKLARAQGEAEKRPPMVAGADNVLARVAARRGKGDEARKLLAAVDALAKGPVRVYTLWREATEAAITRAMIGEKKDAAAQLRAIAEAAAKKAFKQRASDARKALAALP